MSFDYHEYRQVKQSAYSITMNETNKNAFLQFASRFIGGGSKGLKKGDIGLKNAQYSNFQNLRHFGIIEQREGSNKWFLTEKGLQFYNGEIPIESPAGFIGGKTIERHHPAWDTYKGERSLMYINGFTTNEVKRKKEYQEEKTGDTLFNMCYN